MAIVESTACFRSHHRQQIPDVEVAIEFYPFIVGQGSGLGPLRQLQHPLPVGLVEIHCKEEFSSLQR